MSSVNCKVYITDIVDEAENGSASFSIEFSFTVGGYEFIYSIHHAEEYSKKQWLDLANGQKDLMINNLNGCGGIRCEHDNYIFDNYLLPCSPTSSLFTIPKNCVSSKLLNLIDSINYGPWLNEKI